MKLEKDVFKLPMNKNLDTGINISKKSTSLSGPINPSFDRSFSSDMFDNIPSPWIGSANEMAEENYYNEIFSID